MLKTLVCRLVRSFRLGSTHHIIPTLRIAPVVRSFSIVQPIRAFKESPVVRSTSVIRSAPIIRPTPIIRSNPIIRSIIRSTPIIRSFSSHQIIHPVDFLSLSTFLLRGNSTSISQSIFDPKFVKINGRWFEISKIISVRWYTRFWYDIFTKEFGRFIYGNNHIFYPHILEMDYEEPNDVTITHIIGPVNAPAFYPVTYHYDSKKYVWKYENAEECERDCEQINSFIRTNKSH